MGNYCYTYNCPNPATDEYHFYVEVPAMGGERVEVVWELCDKCCEFAVDVVELISNLEEEMMGIPSCSRCGAVGGAKYGGKDVCPDCFVELKEMERKS